MLQKWICHKITLVLFVLASIDFVLFLNCLLYHVLKPCVPGPNFTKAQAVILVEKLTHEERKLFLKELKKVWKHHNPLPSFSSSSLQPMSATLHLNRLESRFVFFFNPVKKIWFISGWPRQFRGGLPAILGGTETAGLSQFPPIHRVSGEETKNECHVNMLNWFKRHKIQLFGRFGFLDNFIMIVAGEYIDITLGATLGISTMVSILLLRTANL